MPRKSREKSQSGIYHIILRGANKQHIFHEESDNQKFLEILAKYTKTSEIRVYGWCLMSNHVHLLLGEGNEELAVTMKRIGVSFVWYYNWKYKTTGHLFQDRFKSENIENDQYLLMVVRYIHQNPVKAGMVKRVEDWKWSSCHRYYGEDSYPFELLNRDLILGMFSTDDNHSAVARFKEYNEAITNDQCLDDKIRLRITDEEARLKIIEQLNGLEIVQVKNLPKVERNAVLRKIKGISGLTQRQAARIFGISPNLIFKA